MRLVLTEYYIDQQIDIIVGSSLKVIFKIIRFNQK